MAIIEINILCSFNFGYTKLLNNGPLKYSVSAVLPPNNNDKLCPTIKN